MKSFLRPLSVVTILVFLISCGSGGSGDNESYPAKHPDAAGILKLFIEMSSAFGDYTVPYYFNYDDKGNLLSIAGWVEDDKARSVTFYEYDKSGNLTKVTAKGKVLESYTYDSDGNISKIILDSTYQFKYDNNNNLIERKAIYKDRGPVYHYFTYYGNNTLESAVLAIPNKSGDIIDRNSRFYTYNGNGHVVSEEFDQFIDNEFDYIKNYSYVYDGNDNIIEKEIETDGGSDDGDYQFFEYAYNSDDRLIEWFTDTGSANSPLYEYEYNSQGLLVKQSIDTNAAFVSWSFEYDSNKRLKKESVKVNGKLKEAVSYEYEGKLPDNLPSFMKGGFRPNYEYIMSITNFYASDNNRGWPVFESECAQHEIWLTRINSNFGSKSEDNDCF